MKRMSGLLGLLVGLVPWAAAFEGPSSEPAGPEPQRFERGWEAPGPGRFQPRGPMPAGPQGRGMNWPWWKNPDVVRELELTPAQMDEIERAVHEHRLKMVDLRADVERQELRLQPLLDAERPDEARVGAQLDLVSAARGRLEKANVLMRLSVRRVLSPEQWKKLRSRRMQRPNWPPRREGRGGMTPPGGRPGPGEEGPATPPRRPE